MRESFTGLERSNYFVVLVVVACLYCLLLPGCSARGTPSPSPTNIPLPSPSPKPFKVGRMFHISSDGYMSRLLRTERKFVASTATIQTYIKHVETGVMKFLGANNSPPANQSLHPCNSDGYGFQKAMANYLIERQLPEPDMSCLTEFEGIETLPSERPPFTTDHLYDAIITRADEMLKNSQKIADIILNNWTTTDVNIHYQYDTTSQRCIINHIGALRIFEKWYIFTTITNAPRRVSVPLFHRHWLTEFIHVDDNGTIGEPLHFSAPKRPKGNGEHILINDTTTTLATVGGSAGPFAFNSMYPEENPALVSAIDKSDLYIQQAQDALAPSNLAILILPLALNLLPIALVAEVTTKFMLFYALMTDIVTVIPLGIKGVELTFIGRQRHRSIVIRLTSSVNGTMPTSAVSELWGAQCRASDNVYPTGILFVCLSIIFMILGVALEFIARAFVARRTLLRTLWHTENVSLVNTPPLAHSFHSLNSHSYTSYTE